MLKALTLRFHRWIALAASLPLAVVLVTGLILSVEPLAQRVRIDPPLTADRLTALLAVHDPDGRAGGLAIQPYDHTMTLFGAGGHAIELRSGAAVEPGGFAWRDLFRSARQIHERLLFDLGWLVTASTIAMLVILGLGLFQGWRAPRNTVGGWHRTAGWVVLPLLILSPLTGLAIAFGVSFAGPPTGGRGERPTVREAVTLIAQQHDLSDLSSLRVRGGRLMARIYEGNVLRGYAVTRAGLQPLPTNWPRALHEGNWHALFGSLANVIVSIALIGLLGTGVVIWARRAFRKRQPRLREARVAAP